MSNTQILVNQVSYINFELKKERKKERTVVHFL